MSRQPPSGDEPPDPAQPEPPATPEPDTETARVPWENAPAQTAPAAPPAASGESAPPAPQSSSGWVTTPVTSGGGLVKACLIIALIGVAVVLFMVVALIYLGSQVSGILNTVGTSV